MKLFLVIADTTANVSDWTFGSGNAYNDILIAVLIIVMIVLLASAIVVQKAMRSILDLTMPELIKQEKETKELSRIKSRQNRKTSWNNILGLRPLEEEKDIEIDHEYDGIKELDNPVPIWFNALFYSTVCFGVVYLLIYQVFGWGLSQEQEYNYEMSIAEKQKLEYLAQAANLIDENTVSVDLSQAAAGKSIFMANCAACHGNSGEGTIGPNLTDRNWLHGGEIKDIFKTVKYGVPEKGMVPWEQTLSPGQIAEVSNYILTLRDSKPTNPKAPEGVEVVYEVVAAGKASVDSTVVK
ncbi:c-type cytochrome [Sphingobacterium alkalisoli]|uniref:C-type cytochrome n=1 Tax=Sphingobacterium alkalisoli TaxID=1874115 RepID=A0A4U0GPN8_9SPHI|nr:cbb3-type cytochrome c oxidase N-terminal domain-containing protein [Sphingobacterium alkalisoli]TJY60783.1 c-type cytochrome [Sphingobacterium alkalisoli]GGH31904.1 cytochrome c oxidase subunit III [Sphingobacterium alkalisoli]